MSFSNVAGDLSARRTCLPRNRTRQTAAQKPFQITSREPVITKCLHIPRRSFNLVVARPDQFKNAKLHGVVLKLSFGNDTLVQGQKNIAIVERPINRRLRLTFDCPRRRSYAYAQTVIFLLRTTQLRRRTADPPLALIEERNREFQDRSDAPRAFGPLARRSNSHFRRQSCRFGNA